MTEENYHKIYLCDGSILPYERETKKNHPAFVCNGSTEIISVNTPKIEIIDEQVGKYRVIGNAAKHLARIKRVDINQFLCDANRERIPEEMILFEGGISIYEDQNPRSQFIKSSQSQYMIERQGDIWLAREIGEDYGNSLLGVGGLSKVIFDEDISERRVEAILAGYQAQEDSSQKVQASMEDRARAAGLKDVKDGWHDRFQGAGFP